MPANAPPRAPGELAEIEAERHELARFIENQIVAQRLQGETMITLVARQETWKLVLASLRSATGDGGEAKGCDLDTAMKRGIRAWSARLHVPVTRMMSRVLREEIRAALQPRPTKIEGADE